jgi:TrmH family RNA methyltransferase
VARFRAAADGDVQWMLLEGLHLVEEALAAGVPLDVVAIATDRMATDVAERITRRVRSDRLVPVSWPVLDALSPMHAPGGVVALAARPAATLESLVGTRQVPLLVGAVDVQDPGNAGAIIRAAEAGGATGVMTTAGGADPFGWKALRGSMGSALRLPVVRCDDIVAAMATAKAAGCQLLAATGADGDSLYDVDFRGPTLVLLGSEGHGLPEPVVAAADRRVAIPMAKPVESLNVAVAAALIVYEARRQRAAAQLHVR